MIAQIEVEDDEIVLHVLGVAKLALDPLEAQRLTNELSRALIATGALARKRSTRVVVQADRCPGLRAFTSAEHARRAHSAASYRIRPFRCEGCGKWHVSADEKNGRRKSGGSR